MKTWMLEQRYIPGGLLAAGLRYVSYRWTPLTRFLSDPRIPIDNNRTEGGYIPLARARCICEKPLDDSVAGPSAVKSIGSMGADAFCDEDGTCKNCVHDCELGTRCCTGAQTQRCARDANGCAKWGPLFDCPGPEAYCSTAQDCTQCEHHCSENQTECIDGLFRACEADEHGCRDWTPKETCPGDDAYCADDRR